MLERPSDLSDERLISRVREAYGLPIAEIAFLPLGADVNTAVFRVVGGDATSYFLKLRRGPSDVATVAIPRLLRDRGMAQVIAPIATRAGRLETRVDGYTATLSPFVEGENGYDCALSDPQWVELGAALRRLHATAVPRALSRRIPRETFSPHFREMVRAFQARAEETDTPFADPVATELAAFLRKQRATVTDLVGRADWLGEALRARSLPFVLCHADIHAWNVLLAANGALYIVDWDTLIFAPKERDLMFIGGGIGGIWHGAHEAALFYEGYGETDVEPMALAYYRYERIVEDIAAYCQELLLTDAGGADRARSLRSLVSCFAPGQVVEVAYAADPLARES